MQCSRLRTLCGRAAPTRAFGGSATVREDPSDNRQPGPGPIKAPGLPVGAVDRLPPTRRSSLPSDLVRPERLQTVRPGDVRPEWSEPARAAHRSPVHGRSALRGGRAGAPRPGSPGPPPGCPAERTREDPASPRWAGGARPPEIPPGPRCPRRPSVATLPALPGLARGGRFDSAHPAPRTLPSLRHTGCRLLPPNGFGLVVELPWTDSRRSFLPYPAREQPGVLCPWLWRRARPTSFGIAAYRGRSPTRSQTNEQHHLFYIDCGPRRASNRAVTKITKR